MSNKSARKIFSENLQRLMKNKNIDQKELAEAIGVTQPTISNWIQELKYPRIKRVQQLSDYFNVTKSELTEEKTTIQKHQVSALINSDVTEEELKEIENFIHYVISKRDNKSDK
ncbi:helix-turn-helix domain-containing protein [Staphylococcus haemolyticus]|uniref:helix-turn-helix domain-containing protein n=1 Tax=Staphylococcus haemolyticus TaxID=1283 RepID=UPI00051CE434|nr:helix-turn-helix transcriptional regulator [Staphylococcus haemolyticus]KGJ25350.1 XRE family transcriptional regulator [Staphylococcus haemolyticus]KGJ29264.1 XRE family transcriptional regulator [Staphylococcus haemolyticus]MCH4326188.1 helix-turn-helix domain-containing protein [Staphylococcus haemolyticus]MCH4414287.1 helix-turn-helix domain-containing protein [Staphylococcus haemolyticus]MCH4419097.1 helix-turn-helix domain-containing protein [Staphylococcus haemolyticus]